MENANSYYVWWCMKEDDFSDSRMLESYREQRLQEMKQKMVQNRFGDVTEIVKAEWVREVTEGSQTCAVLVHLYQDALVECQIMDEMLRRLAPKFKYLKCLRIKSDQAIENWPDRNCPALFIYTNGSLKTQIITLKELGGKIATADGKPFS
jgi:hypothetical protein